VSDVVLRDLGLTKEATVEEIEAVIGRGPTAVTGQQPFTPRAKKVLDEAGSAAAELGHDYIGTEHLLLALFRGQDGLAKVVLWRRGAVESTVRVKIVEHLTGVAKDT
jgi:ATP-dependent Clp protease ATP-binding subunit ClpC